MTASSKLYIQRHTLNQIKEIASKAKKTETGGVIAGTGILNQSDVIIKKCSPPGPKAIEKRYFFSRDTIFCQKLLNKWVTESKGSIDYLGEWHKHMELDPSPSNRDLTTMYNINRDPSYHIDNCIMIIVGIKLKINVFILNGKSYKKVDWEIIED